MSMHQMDLTCTMMANGITVMLLRRLSSAQKIIHAPASLVGLYQRCGGAGIVTCRFVGHTPRSLVSHLPTIRGCGEIYQGFCNSHPHIIGSRLPTMWGCEPRFHRLHAQQKATPGVSGRRFVKTGLLAKPEQALCGHNGRTALTCEPTPHLVPTRGPCKGSGGAASWASWHPRARPRRTCRPRGTGRTACIWPG